MIKADVGAALVAGPVVIAARQELERLAS